MYNWTAQNSDGFPAVCFYDANGVVHGSDRHVRVWTKCLLQKDLDGVDPKSEIGKKMVENAGRKIADIYVPPYALFHDIDHDQAIIVTGWEVVANLGGLQTRARFLVELNCSERMTRRLSTTAQAADKVLTLACQGTATTNDANPEPIFGGIIVNFADHTVHGLGYPDLLGTPPLNITYMNEANVHFGHYSGNQTTEISIIGGIDRVTGDMDATSMVTNAKTREVLTRTTYSLKCKPTQRMF